MSATGPIAIVGDPAAGVCDDGVCVIPAPDTSARSPLRDIPFDTVDGHPATLGDLV